MNDLSQHLSLDASHARLPFHPRCPRCRDERLLGAADLRPLVSRKLGLGGAAALLLAASFVPSVAAATAPAPARPAVGEPDTENEGTGPAGSPPGQGEEPPESDYEGPDSDQIEENSPPLAPPEDPSKPREGENENGPLETTPPPEETPPPEQPSEPPGPATPPPPADRAPVQPEGVPPGGEAGQGEPQGDRGDAEAPRTKPDRLSESNRSQSRDLQGKRKPTAAQTPNTKAPSALKPLSAVPLDAAPGNRGNEGNRDSGSRAGRIANDDGVAEDQSRSTPSSFSGDTHIVQSGETLWSIATTRLGGSPAPAEVAREVQRLWNLNAEAIGTGDPDLVRVGQKLQLR